MTWVCGDQRVLVEEVVDQTIVRSGATSRDSVSLWGGFNSDRDIWAQANQYPLDPEASRLVVIRDAEKIQNWKPLTQWFADARNLPTYLLFVSNEADFPCVIENGKRTKQVQPHIEAINIRKRKVAQAVRCSMPNEADAIAWIQWRTGLDLDTARYLLVRTGGDLRAAAFVGIKLKLFPGRAARTTIDFLCDEAPAGTFVECLIQGQKRHALLALEGMSFQDYSRAIGLLDSRLDLLSTICHALRAGYGSRETQKLPTFLVQQFLPVAKFYDDERCTQSRRVLAVVDDALRSGASDGVMEALVALW